MNTTSVVDTPRGPARLLTDAGERGLLVLGHGAGGGPEAPDLLAARAGALQAGFAVARVEQPWRVKQRRVAEAPAHLDAAWLAVLAALAGRWLGGPLVVGGRSSGARVACRTATAVGARGVLALAFPLVPPGRAATRAGELTLPTVPRLVVQGSRDAFGLPAAGPGLQVAVVEGADHAFAVRRSEGRSRADVLAEVQRLVGEWLQTVT
jgi:predicted alpha/beta-hydrolase family hydrolase